VTALPRGFLITLNCYLSAPRCRFSSSKFERVEWVPDEAVPISNSGFTHLGPCTKPDATAYELS